MRYASYIVLSERFLLVTTALYFSTATCPNLSSGRSVKWNVWYSWALLPPKSGRIYINKYIYMHVCVCVKVLKIGANNRLYFEGQHSMLSITLRFWHGFQCLWNHTCNQIHTDQKLFHLRTIVSFIVLVKYMCSIETILVLKIKHPGLSRSTPLLLMPWLPASLGHQESWYRLCKIDGPLSSTRMVKNTYLAISYASTNTLNNLVEDS